MVWKPPALLALCAALVVGTSSAQAPAELILDNLDASTTRTGNWKVSSGADPWAGQSVYNNSGNVFRWLPTIPETGTYEVYAWWTFHSNRSTTVPYRIAHAGGTTEIIVNQRDSSLGGRWNLLGTVPLNAGSGHYVEVSSENGQASADAVRLVQVDTTPTPLTVVTTSLPDATLGVPYDGTVTASGGTEPYTWSMVSGSLPDGLSLDPATGEIGGTPAAVVSETFTVGVDDDAGGHAEAILSITVSAAPTELIVDDLDASTTQTGSWKVSSGPSPWAGQSVYNDGGNVFRWLPAVPVSGTYEVYGWWTFHSNRSTAVPYRIAHAGGTTETIVDQKDSSLGGRWNLLGTVPLNAGSGHYVEVSSENGQASADAVRLVRVDTTPTPLTVSTTSLAAANVGTPYGETLTASGGTLPYAWSLVGGSLPDGLDLDPSSGAIGGTPTTVENATFTVGVDDAGGDHAEAVLSITVSAPPTELIIDDLDPDTERTGTWSVSSGPNPWAGQSVYNNSGKSFRWLPTIPVTGTYEVHAWWTFHANRSKTVPYRIAHAGGTTETIVNQRDPSLGGQWNWIGTVVMEAGASHYVEVSSENGQASADAVRLSFVGDRLLTLVEDALAEGVVGTAYGASVNASGGLPPYVFTLDAGSLPSGVTLAPSGVLSGVPTWGETASFTVRVEDARSDVATADFLIAVSPFAGVDFGHPYLQNTTTDGITILWWTPTDRAGLLEYGIGGYDDSAGSSPEPITFTRPDAGSDVVRYKHEVRLSGLTAGSEYQYRVTQDDVTFVSEFRTAPGETLTPIRFLVWADTETELASHGTLGAGAPAGYPMDQNEGITAGVLASSSLSPDFILIAGDIVEQAGRLDDWDELFRKVNDENPVLYPATPPLASRVPIFAALGNHDYFGFGFSQPGSEVHGVHKYLEHFDNPSNVMPTTIVDPAWPSELDPAVRAAQNERYFAFDYGPATLIAIDVNNQSPNGSGNDTNFNILGENDPGGGFAPDWAPGSRQYQWLEEELQRARSRSLFVFVYWHHAAFSSGPHALPPGIDDQSGLPTRQLDELFHRYRVTAVFNGHEEMVEMSETTGDPALGGDPAHVIRYFVPSSLGDGIRDELSGLLNPRQVFHYGDSAIGRHYGFVLVDIFPDPGDPGTWKAVFRQAWIDPAWADDPSLAPLGGYYDDADPAAFYEAIWTPP